MQSFTQKLRSKYALYLLCFVALNLIEFLRSTQPGNIWAAAANCTGLVMMVIIFSQLPLREFLKPINYIYTVICIVAIGVIYWHWTQHSGEYYFGQMATAVMNIWWIGLLVPYLFRKVIEEKKLSLRIGALGWTWIAFTVWSVISVAGRWWPLWFLLMFGSFYLIRFSREDWTALLDAMIDGTIASFFVIQSYAYLFRPYDVVRYSGAFNNCNMMALYYLIVYCMVLFKIHLLHVRKAKLGWKIFYLIGAGGLCGFMFLTICRTSWACAVVLTVCYGFIVLRRAWGDKLGKLIARGCLLVLVAVVAFPAVFLTVRWLPTIHPHPIWYDGEWSEWRVHSWEPADSEKYIELDEFLDTAIGRLSNTLKLLLGRSPLVLHVRAESLDPGLVVVRPEPWGDSFLGVRKAIYQTYIEHSTWMGHGEQEGEFIFEESGYHPWHAQNLWIQILFYFGYPAGALLVLMTLLTMIKTVKKSGNITVNPYAEVPLIICLLTFLFGLTEVVWNPGQLIMALVFFVMHPQFTEKIAEESADQ